MHLIESYSLASGSKIEKSRILEKFFPLAVDKYITIQPNSKYNSKCYDFIQDVVDELVTILNPLGIHIVQIGSKNDRQLKGVYSTAGQTSINQVAFILSRSLLHLGMDSFATHIASAYGKKIVCLYSNNYISCVRPYWSKPEDCVLLEPDRKGGKPSFSAEENPKSINEIRPESIVAGVCKLLNIPYENKLQTLFIGQNYYNKFIETLPNQILDNRQFGIESLIVRMDFHFDENALAEQLKICKCSIVTDKPINLNLLAGFRGNIRDLIFRVNKTGYLSFVQGLQQLNINAFLLTNLKDKELETLKLEYLDLGAINVKPDLSEHINKIKEAKKTLYYKSSKVILSEGKIYPSRAALLVNKPADSMDSIQEVIDCKEFWEELEYFRILL